MSTKCTPTSFLAGLFSLAIVGCFIGLFLLGILGIVGLMDVEAVRFFHEARSELIHAHMNCVIAGWVVDFVLLCKVLREGLAEKKLDDGSFFILVLMLGPSALMYAAWCYMVMTNTEGNHAFLTTEAKYLEALWPSQISGLEHLGLVPFQLFLAAIGVVVVRALLKGICSFGQATIRS